MIKGRTLTETHMLMWPWQSSASCQNSTGQIVGQVLTCTNIPIGRIGACTLLSTRENTIPNPIAAPVEISTRTSVQLFSLEDVRESAKSKLPIPPPRVREPAKSMRANLARRGCLAAAGGIAGRTLAATIREEKIMKGS
jgi:hypothetical protein